MSDRIEGLAGRLAAGEALSDADLSELGRATDILTLGMLADEARRRRHGAQTTYVRVADVSLPAPGGVLAIPTAAGEVRVKAAASDFDAVLPALYSVVTAAGHVPVSAFSLADLQAHSRTAGRPLIDLLRSIRRAGVAAIAEAPLDMLDDAEAALESVREAGLFLARLTVQCQADADVRVGLIKKAAELQHALGWLRSFAPLPRLWSAGSPTTGYEDMRQVALARLLADNIPTIQVDWSLYGPKLAQVALTFGADDVDAVAPLDDLSEGRRRAPLEEVRRNIQAAGLGPAERDGVYGRVAG